MARREIVTQGTTVSERLSDVAGEVVKCTKCPLHQSRLHAVPGEGDPDASLVFVGEAPGYNEDREGRPFVGQAGRVLDELLTLADLKREKVYITNLVKCRPPRNRPPRKKEIETCSAYLESVLKILEPQAIVPLGRYSLGYFQTKFGLESHPIGEVHGKGSRVLASWGAVDVFPLYHPAVALYADGVKAGLVDDVGRLKQLLLERGYV